MRQVDAVADDRRPRGRDRRRDPDRRPKRHRPADAKLRVGMRASLAQLHQRLGVTTVYVTHDQTEAMTLGQRVAVMRDGKVLQVDRPKDLYERPSNLFIASFIGSPTMNLVQATVRDDGLDFGQFRVPFADGRPPAGLPETVVLGIRPAVF